MGYCKLYSELANVNKDLTAIAVNPLGGEMLMYSNSPLQLVTLQSTGKMVPLIGFLKNMDLISYLNG